MSFSSSSSKATMLPTHPYHPIDLELADYVANEWDTLTLASTFGAGCAAILSITYLVGRRVKPQVSTGDLWTIKWFVLCGCIHLFFEGYFAYNFRHMGSKQDLFGQLWKEYSLSDSRYQTQNAFVLCMETITAICWGPLSFVVAWTITKENPLRYPLQAIVSLGHLYGDVLYFATSLFDHYILGLSYSRPEPLYFWGYFVFLNAVWIVVPAFLLYNSVMASRRAFRVAALGKTVMANNGRAKKAL